MMEIVQLLICLYEISVPFLFAEYNFEKKRLRIPLNMLWIVCMGINLLLMNMQRMIIMYSWLFMLLSIVTSTVLMLWRYKVRWLDTVTCNGIYYACIYVFDLLFIICHFINKGMDCGYMLMEVLTWERMLFFLISRCIVSVFVYLIHCKRYIRIVYQQNRQLFFFIPIILFVGLYQCDGIMYGFEKKSVTLRNLTIFFVFCLFIVFLLMVLYMKSKYEYEKMLVQEKNRMIEVECNRILQWNKERDLLLHDFKNHMIVLEMLIKEGQTERAREYVRSLMSLTSKGLNTIITDHPVIDALLNEKLNEARTKSINVEYDVCQLKDSFVEDTDWCILLANLLDNAIEACEKLTENRYLQIKIIKMPCGILINVINSYFEIKKKQGKMVTTKTNSLEHGLGLRSVLHMLRKYHGEIHCKEEEDRFIVTVILYQ